MAWVISNRRSDRGQAAVPVVDLEPSERSSAAIRPDRDEDEQPGAEQELPVLAVAVEDLPDDGAELELRARSAPFSRLVAALHGRRLFPRPVPGVRDPGRYFANRFGIRW